MNDKIKAAEQSEKPKNKVLSAITSAIEWIYMILVQYSKFVLIVIVVVVSAQVFSRKILHSSIRWSEELTLVLMVWMAFISMAIGVRENLHIAIEMFFNKLPVKAQKFFNSLNNLFISVVGIVLLVYGIILIKYTTNSTLPATKLPACTLYLMLPVGGFFIAYYSLLRLFGLERYIPKTKETEEK
ncbi:MAG: TRAP transporter small permease [Candidatus Limivicinus sp.]|jgi:TRAP-type C4-dicarboxylate transport system permease small subunit